MKTDSRVKYTLHIIQNVFFELLKEKPLSKITVKELCDKAEINRGTFYKHYQDVYDLMEQLENVALSRFEDLLISSQENGNLPTLVTLLTSLQEYGELIEALTVNSSSRNFMNRLTEICTQYALANLSFSSKTLAISSNKHYVYSYLAGGTSNLITHWLQTGKKETPQQLAETIENMNNLILSIPDNSSSI